MPFEVFAGFLAIRMGRRSAVGDVGVPRALEYSTLLADDQLPKLVDLILLSISVTG